MSVSCLYPGLLLALFMSPIKSFLPKNNGELSAAHEFYFLGEPVTFTCNVINSSVLTVNNASTNDIYIRRPHSQEAVGQVTSRNKTSVTVTVEVTSVNDGGMYYCNVGPPPQERLGLGNWYIQLDYPLEAVNNMSCVTENFIIISCRYELPLDYIHPDKIIATVFYFLPDYEEPEEECYRGVERNFTLGPGNNLDSNYTFIIQLTHKDRNESLRSKPFFFNPQAQVKPERVKNLRYVNVSSRTVSLRWESSDERHSYICTVDSATTTTQHRLCHQHVSGVLEPSRVQEMTVSDLVPFTNYSSSVQCRPTTWTQQPFGYNSDRVYIIFQTLPDRPDAAPLLAPAVSRPTHQDIQLYWQPLEKMRENGRLLYYSIKLAYEGQIERKKVYIGKNTLRVPLGLLLSELQVSLSVHNTVGESPASTLTVFPRDAETTIDPNFRVTGQGNDSELTFHWSLRAGTTKCYVYWCHKKMAGTSCQNQLVWKTSPCVNGNVTVDTGRHLVEQSLLLGFSREMERPPQARTSIHWTHCVYLRQAVPGPMKGVRLSKSQPPGRIRLEWQALDCMETPVFLSHYIVSYCTVRQRHDMCQGSTKTDIVSSWETRHDIGGLEADMYRVSTRAVSLDLQGPASSPLYFRVKPDVDGDHFQTPLFISFGVAMFVVALCLVYRCKKCCRKGEQIIIPECPPDKDDINNPTMKKGRKRHRKHSTLEGCEMCDIGNTMSVKQPVSEELGSSLCTFNSETSWEVETYRIVATEHEASTSGVVESYESEGLLANCGSSVSPESAVRDMSWMEADHYAQSHRVYQTSDVEEKKAVNPFPHATSMGYVRVTDTGQVVKTSRISGE